jgi:hypothetical protein
MWYPFKKANDDFNKRVADMEARYRAVENFAPIGSFIEYLDTKMMVVGYHDTIPRTEGCDIIPSLRVQWMNQLDELQQCSIGDWKIKFCKLISTPENSGTK